MSQRRSREYNDQLQDDAAPAGKLRRISRACNQVGTSHNQLEIKTNLVVYSLSSVGIGNNDAMGNLIRNPYSLVNGAASWASTALLQPLLSKTK